MKTDFCERVMLDGVVMAASAARISPLGDGFMFGHGIFETIRVLAGRPAFFAEHAARLERSARELGLKVSDGLGGRVRELLATNALEQGALKIVVFQSEAGTGELVTMRPLVYSAAKYDAGFCLKTFPDVRAGGGIEALKSLNYLKNRRARAAAQAAGFDDALFVDERGGALESSTANLFIVIAGEIFTPPIASGVLPGVARGVVFSLNEGRGVREGTVTAAMLNDVDEVFVTNALLGVMPVSRIDERVYGVNAQSLMGKIAADFREAQVQSLRKV